VVVPFGQEALEQIEDIDRVLIVGEPLQILGQNLRPRPIHQINFIILVFTCYKSVIFIIKSILLNRHTIIILLDIYEIVTFIYLNKFI
jgi:hypothetical protein